MRDTTRLERTSMVLEGDRSQLRLESGRITITKQSTTQRRPVTVTVPLEQVRGATVDRPSRGQRGWFHLAVVGGSVRPASEIAASVDPYAIPLAGRETAAAKRLARLVADHVRRRGLPAESPDDQLASSSAVTITPTGTHRDAAPEPDAVVPHTNGDAPPAPPTAPTDEGDRGTALHLCELADLHRAGVLTDDEYERARDRIAAAADSDGN